MTCCIEAGLSLGASVTMLLTVSSRSWGLVSTKPMLTLAKRLSLTTLDGKYSRVRVRVMGVGVGVGLGLGLGPPWR